MTYTISDTVDNLNVKEIIFNPQQIHKNHIENFERKYGDEIEDEFKKTLNIIYKNFHKLKKCKQSNKFYSILLLSDGITTLINVFHSYLIGYSIEGFVLLRYYIECLGLSYGIYVNGKLFQEWKNNNNNKNANYFTSKGLNILYKKYPDVKGIWNEFSKISHLEYNTTRTTYLQENIITIGGAHTSQRNPINRTTVESAELMLKLTNKIFGEDLKLLESR